MEHERAGEGRRDRPCASGVARRVPLPLRAVATLGGGLLLVLALACWHPRAAAAATLIVTTTDDTVAAGDGLSLREAILCVNAGSNAPAAECPASPAPGYGTSDTILFSIPGTGAQTLALSSALPALAKSVVIDATGQSGGLVVDGGCALNIFGLCLSGGVRPFTVNSGVTATLTSLTIRRGDTANGGGVFNNGTLTLTNCTLASNGSVLSTTNGGGIFNAASASLTITSSTLAFNGASVGGGIDNAGTLVMSTSTLSSNSAADSGGGIANGGTLTLTASTLIVNKATNDGGGIANAGGTLTLTNSTLASNHASSGGGIFNTGTLTATNCTLSNNGATTSDGGIFQSSGTATLANTIVAGNTAPSNPDVAGAFTSGGQNLIGIVDGSTGFDGFDRTGTAASPLDALLGPLGNYGGPTQTLPLLPGSPAIDAGNNTICTTTTGTAPVNKQDQRGVLRPQLDNCDIGAFESQGFVMIAAGANQATPPGHPFGGALRVIVSSSHGDPVQGGRINFKNPAQSPGPSATFSGNPATIDATGAASVTATANGTAGTYTIDALFTLHAVGAKFTLTNGQVPCTVDSTLDQGDAGKRTLRDAVDSANGGGCIGNAITFDATAFPAGTPRTITLNGAFGTLSLSAAMTIAGTGHRVVVDGGCTVNGSGQCASGGVRVFIVNTGVTAAISGLTIQHGNVTSGGGGGGIEVLAGSTLTLADCTIAASASGNGGGGIDNEATLTVTDCTITGNTAKAGGGGIFNFSGGTLTVTNSTIVGNSTPLGGGGITNSGTLTVTNGTIAGNSASTSAGGISNETGAAATLVNTIVAGNTVPSSPDVGGTFTSGGHNLIGKKDGSSGFTNGVNGDQVGTAASPLNPLLGTLADNGGPTPTIALLPGSPAIDAGKPTVCATAPVSGKDERGYLRRSDRCSIGAFEADPAIPNALPPPAPSASPVAGVNPLPVGRPAGSTQGGAVSPLPSPRP